ncbi:MAG: MBL fold metallo-hydrolase [Methyloversatilis sp.]|uniref:MBL fold metallo-hydrolase n=1 Tax=Methyloversatilis sp. TaxID=2569862 RepID=UPI00273707CB|nr:MBL fold metallo-hydrolase [Methyloversatilis sp.]MDP3872382.1 MBL fold metallo-hydrolase [Methyloversatilis sp.]
MSSSSMQIEAFFDEATSTVSYLVLDRSTQACAIVDSVLDYDPKAGRTSTQSADRLIARVRELGARLEWILETHVHADHLSAAPHLREQLGGQLGIGAHIVTVQKVFGSLFNAGDDFARDGRQFDRLFADGDSFTIGSLTARALHTPGHTPACMSYVIEDAVFVGDTLFMPDYGTARCDFPGGDARTLYRSVRRLLSLPPATRLFMCHDYPPGGRAPAWESTVAEQRAHNIHVHDGIAEDEFVAMRTARDATLDMPVLILPSVQVNMRAGHLPEPEANGTRYLKIPLDVL